MFRGVIGLVGGIMNCSQCTCAIYVEVICFILFFFTVILWVGVRSMLGCGAL